MPVTAFPAHHTRLGRRQKTIVCPTARDIFLLLFCALAAPAQTVDIGVFSLFRPTELRIAPVSAPILVATPNARQTLEGRQIYRIRLSQLSGPIQVSARDGAAADFTLAIPGKIDRRFRGVLTVRPGDHKLIATVTIDREVAVASVVAAEMPPTSPIEALKAQAVVARSYYVAAGRRHDEYAFCDTTHCQFLREAPASGAPLQAALETRGLILEYNGHPLAALYSSSCGGRTRAFDDVSTGYMYRSVDCEYCRRHAPGVVQGHQLGLCQSGASGMAAAGAGFRAILEHYFPATALAQPAPRSFSIFLLPALKTLRHSKDE